MATWTGWENEFLNRAGIIETPPNRTLLDSWAKNAHTSCGNNPIDLSHKLTGSTNCATLPGIFPHAQHYTSHAQAATAFRDEIHLSFAKTLLDAMNTGNPYQVKNFNDVASVFISWGSDTMADVYLNAAQGGGPSGGPVHATGVHKGWADLQRSLGKRGVGTKISATNRMDAATLRALRRAHKVRLK